MARNAYPLDEFDRLPEGSPAGVHRRVPSPWTRVVVFVAIVASFVGLGWGAAHIYLIADDVSWLNWLRPQTVENSPVVAPTTEVTAEPSVVPSASPSESVTLLTDANVIVFLSGADSGNATEVQDYILGESDFTVVSNSNWAGASPSGNAIRFATEEYEDSARYLAELLDIATVNIGPTEGASIAIILVTNLSLGGPSADPTPSA